MYFQKATRVYHTDKGGPGPNISTNINMESLNEKHNTKSIFFDNDALMAVYNIHNFSN